MSAPAEDVLEAFDPLDPATIADPYPVYARLRERSAAFYAPAIDMWVVTRADDIDAVLRDPATYSASIAQDPLAPLIPEAAAVLADGGFGAAPVMSNLDPPEHARIRKHNMSTFSIRRIATLEEEVRRRATELVGAMVPLGGGDLVALLHHPLPAHMIFRLIGFPEADTAQLKAWTGNRLVFTWGRPSPDEQVAVARRMVDYWRYVAGFVAGRLADPADDFTSDLVRIHRADPSALSITELTNVVYGLSFAGHENLTSMTTNAVRQLLGHRDQWDELCADPGRIPDAVEECLRYDSSNPGWRRRTTTAVRIGGVDVPAGAKLLLLLGAANRDPAWYADPERFDIHRQDNRRHLAFGRGIHYCLGAALVRLELRVVLEQLTGRLPGLRLVEGQPLDYTPNVAFRAPRRLLAEWPPVA